jgi:chemotaxis protein methyltransferase CheR
MKKENIFIDSLTDTKNDNIFKHTEIQEIIKIVNKYCNKNLSVYTDSFLINIFNKRLEARNLKSIKDYILLITNDVKEVEILLKLINISYSIFFRNLVDYSIIEKNILPKLFETKINNNLSSVRIWSVACSNGQEPYSLSIIAEDLIRRQFKDFSVQITASDISKNIISKAKKGIYNPDSIQNVRFKHLNEYFEKKNLMYFIKDNIKSRIKFVQYDILDKNTFLPSNEIFNGYDMIVCCNLMIYYKRDNQKFILDKIYRALNKNGYLLVDESEKSIVEDYNGLQNICSYGNLFIKRGTKGQSGKGTE